MLIRQRECHSYYRDVHLYASTAGYDASRHDEKMNMFIFCRSQIKAESKSNRNFDNYVTVESKLIAVESQL